MSGREDEEQRERLIRRLHLASHCRGLCRKDRGQRKSLLAGKIHKYGRYACTKMKGLTLYPQSWKIMSACWRTMERVVHSHLFIYSRVPTHYGV